MVPAFPGALEPYGTFPFQWELQWELGKVSGALKTNFFGVPTFPGVGEYKACREIC